MSRILVSLVLVFVACFIFTEAHKHGPRRRFGKDYKNKKLLCKEETLEGEVLFDEPCDFPELMDCVKAPFWRSEHEDSEDDEDADKPRGRWNRHRAERRRDRRQRLQGEEEQEERTNKYFCIPRECDMDDASSCPEGSQCLRPHKFGARDNRPARCEVSCDQKLFLHACLVEDENGDIVKPEMECGREGATCSEDRSEVITLDDQDLTAYFCSKGEDSQEEEAVSAEEEETEDEEYRKDIRTKICKKKGNAKWRQWAKKHKKHKSIE